MKTADAHCDTLYAFPGNPFNTPEAAWNIEKFNSANGVLQYMDICVLPPNHGDSAMREAVTALGNFHKRKPEEIQLLEKSKDYDEKKINIILSLEGASPLIDDISNLHAYHRLGVRAITLTWNHRNFIADGVGVKDGFGLTGFGKDVVSEMEKLGMIVDVSHLNEAGFKDLCDIAQKPFIASHSNAYDVHAHERNLKEWQAKEIIARKGFIGLNFYSQFLTDSKDREHQIQSLLNHAAYYLNLGAGDVLGIGADFDGIPESPYPDVTSYPELAELFLKELKLSEEQVEKIMYKNLVDYTLKMI